ncbi:hypothetical protein GCM10011445_12280 [Pseudocitrobacter faecalis]|nr:hypothetical protein GCM10011445_12280 [Pseudocitrobacter faecalis]
MNEVNAFVPSKGKLTINLYNVYKMFRYRIDYLKFGLYCYRLRQNVNRRVCDEKSIVRDNGCVIYGGI